MPAAGGTWRGFCSSALELFFPSKCALCSLLSDDCPCPTCRAEMIESVPFHTREPEGPLDFRSTLYRYEGRAAQAVRRLKYDRATSLESFMSEEMAAGVQRLGDFDLLIPVPIHWSRRFRRGFNQAELLGEELGCDSTVLKRIRPTRPQARLTREQRLRNLQGAFRATPVPGKSVLLIDDVVTSGQTARECARVLKDGGAREVGILAFCGDPEW